MTVEDNLAVLREQLARAEAKSRDLITQYVANRRRSYEAYARLDPDSPFTKNAKELLDKATRDFEEFEAKLVTLHKERARLSAANDEATERTAEVDEGEHRE